VKKWVVIIVVLAVLLLSSIGINTYQLISNNRTGAEQLVPLNNASLIPELPNKYFLILFDDNDINAFVGPVIAYDSDGKKVFEVSFESLANPDDAPVWVEYEQYGYGYDWVAAYLDEPLKISGISAGSIDIDGLKGLTLSSNHVYKMAQGEFKDVTAEFFTIK